jgi:hypothetical protein
VEPLLPGVGIVGQRTTVGRNPSVFGAGSLIHADTARTARTRASGRSQNGED